MWLRYDRAGTAGDAEGMMGCDQRAHHNVLGSTVLDFEIPVGVKVKKDDKSGQHEEGAVPYTWARA